MPTSSSPSIGGSCWSAVLSTHDPEALSELSNVEDSLPSKALCFLLILIWRRSLDPEAQLYLNVVPEPGCLIYL